MKKIETAKAPAAIGPYSQAVLAGGFIYVSGQIPVDPATGAVVDGGISVQTVRVLDNLEAILSAAGSSLDHVAKTEVYLKEMGDFAAMNEVYANKFSGPIKPARVTVEVSRLPKDVLVEISCTAVVS